MNPMQIPGFLNKGDTVSIVAPAFCMSEKTLLSACKLLEGWGLVPEYSDLVLESCKNFSSDIERYAGSDRERASDLTSAYLSDSKAILCMRGGYGALRLSGLLDKGLFSSHPKWLLGFSDITTLHAMSLSEGVCSLHGPMCAGLNDEVRDILFGKLPKCETFNSGHYVQGMVNGTLAGGNMITLAALLGTRWDILDHDEVILFIEEVGESFHAIDRLIRVIVSSPKFCNVRGIVFGEFTDCIRDLEFDSAEEMLYEFVKSLGIPVAFGFPAGHGAVNRPFVEGAEVSLSVGSDGNSEISYL